MKRKPTAIEAEAIAYGELLRAIQKFYRHDAVFTADVKRLLSAVCARYFDYAVEVTVVKR